MGGLVTSLRKEGDLFVASGPDREMQAKFVLLATGLVDHCPEVEGAPPDCPIEAVRFCPICDGYEATDRRVGVLGDLASSAQADTIPPSGPSPIVSPTPIRNPRSSSSPSCEK